MNPPSRSIPARKAGKTIPVNKSVASEKLLGDIGVAADRLLVTDSSETGISEPELGGRTNLCVSLEIINIGNGMDEAADSDSICTPLEPSLAATDTKSTAVSHTDINIGRTESTNACADNSNVPHQDR